MSVSTKQARLIAAIRDAQEAQGVTGAELSRRAGTSQSVISQALGGKANMNEERWRMCCEFLGLDYDEVVSDPDTSPPPERGAGPRTRCGRAAGGACALRKRSAGRKNLRPAGRQSAGGALPGWKTAGRYHPWHQHAAGRSVHPAAGGPRIERGGTIMRKVIKAYVMCLVPVPLPVAIDALATAGWR